MSKVGLMEQRREGRTLFCCLQFGTVEALLGFLYAECCLGIPTTPEEQQKVRSDESCPATGCGDRSG
jgi:hypothetical protein